MDTEGNKQGAVTFQQQIVFWGKRAVSWPLVRASLVRRRGVPHKPKRSQG